MNSKLKYFIFFLILPTVVSFKLGGLRLTPCRVILLVNFLSSFNYVVSGRNYGKDKVDIVIILFSLWCFISFAVNHGAETAIESGGVLVLETITPFMLARSLLRSNEDIELLFGFFIKIIIFLLFILIPEFVIGINLFGEFVYPLMGQSYFNGIDQRFGFTRSRASFDHPIISGVFCSSMIGIAWFTEKKIKPLIFIVVATITSLSSGAIASIMVQFMIITWNKVSVNFHNRWRLLGILIIFSYLVIELLSNRSGIKVIISYLTFSPATAYWRTIIWDYGIINAQNNPFFGIGFNDWIRPAWMHSGSMDNFFLVIMVRHGFPAFGLLAFSILSIAYRVLGLKVKDKKVNAMRRGWLSGLIGLIISGCTVHFWNQAYIFFMFYLGVGLVILKINEKQYVK